MGLLIEMPFDDTLRQDRQNNAFAERTTGLGGPCRIDFSVWRRAPRERTPAYFPVYSAVSRAIQATLREWVREWVSMNLEVLRTPHTAYGILVYQNTHPFAGKPTNIFTYDIQETKVLRRAFRSSAAKLRKFLQTLDTRRFGWFTRQHYFAYRSAEVVKYVGNNPRVLYRMLHVETMLVDAILRFSIVDLPALGMEEATLRLRRKFAVQLRRFSNLFDLSVRTDELLKIATEALVEKMSAQCGCGWPRVA